MIKGDLCKSDNINICYLCIILQKMSRMSRLSRLICAIIIIEAERTLVVLFPPITKWLVFRLFTSHLFLKKIFSFECKI